MSVTVLAFARYRELLGFSRIELILLGPTLLGELLERPEFEPLPQEALLAVNQKFVGREEPLVDGDEVALMPPVSGG
ncbi:MAG: MoaD/ThiS family protein [Holophagales bacterium]|nr:MoaD/ThiS family protein [Holophagales bacterium]